jgi:hypothetical protein
MSFPLRDTQIRMSQCPSYRSNQLRAGHPRRPRRRTSARGRHTVAKTGRARSASLNIAIGASHPPLTRAQVHNARMDTHAHAPAFISRRCAGYMRVEYAVTSTASADMLPATCYPSAFAQVDMQHFFASRDGVTGGCECACISCANAYAHACRVMRARASPK